MKTLLFIFAVSVLVLGTGATVAFAAQGKELLPARVQQILLSQTKVESQAQTQAQTQLGVPAQTGSNLGTQDRDQDRTRLQTQDQTLLQTQLREQDRLQTFQEDVTQNQGVGNPWTTETPIPESGYGPVPGPDASCAPQPQHQFGKP